MYSRNTFDSAGNRLYYRSAIEAGVKPDLRPWLLLHLDSSLADSGRYRRTDITSDATFEPSGKFGGAILTDEPLVIPYTENPFSGDFTIQCWAKAAPGYSRSAVVALAVDQYIGIDTYAGTWNMWAGNGSWSILQSDTDDSDPSGNSGRGTVSIVEDTWTHLAFVHYDDQWVLFVDGAESRRKTRAGSISYTNQSIRFGVWGDNIFGADLTLDEIRIDKRALWTSAFTLPTSPY